MKRIGIAASKISKGNLALYNFYVVLLSFLFSIFIFIVSGASVIFALVVLAYIGQGVQGVEAEKNWSSILSVCMGVLTVIVVLFNFIAIYQNFRFRHETDLIR